MAYRLRRKDTSVAKGIRRIAREQIDKGIRSIDRADDPADAVHDVRVRCKKIRGLIRLVRPVFENCSEENADFRDIARLLSVVRDTEVMQDTYDKLLQDEGVDLDRRALGQVRRHFTLKGKADLDRANVAKLLEECRTRLAGARDRAAKWKVDENGWDAMIGGLSETYARARKAASDVREQPSAESYHELRKQLKYHWFHSLLLKRIRPVEMDVRGVNLKRLTEVLGDQHDLAVFTNRITDDFENFGATQGAEMALVLSHRRRVMLEAQIFRPVDDLLTETPDALFGHWHALWISWRKRK